MDATGRYGVVACLFVVIVSGAGQETIYAEKGDVLTIKPPPIGTYKDLIWKINGDKVVEYDGDQEEVYRSFQNRTILDKSSGELKIKDLLIEDSGMYELEVVSLDDKINTSSYPVVVLGKVPKPTITCAVEGDHQAKLVCSAESIPRQSMQLEWSFNGTKRAGSNLTIPLGGKHDDTVYTCHVRNLLNKEEEVSFTAKQCNPVSEKTQITWQIIVPLLLFAVIVPAVIFRKKIKDIFVNPRARCWTAEANPPTSNGANVYGDARTTSAERQPFTQNGDLEGNPNAGKEVEVELEVITNGAANSESVDPPAAAPQTDTWTRSNSTEVQINHASENGTQSV